MCIDFKDFICLLLMIFCSLNRYKYILCNLYEIYMFVIYDMHLCVCVPYTTSVSYPMWLIHSVLLDHLTFSSTVSFMASSRYLCEWIMYAFFLCMVILQDLIFMDVGRLFTAIVLQSGTKALNGRLIPLPKGRSSGYRAKAKIHSER